MPLRQHADPADVGHDGDLGAPRAAQERPPRAGARPDPDRDPRRPLHRLPGLRVHARRLQLRRPHLRLDVLHGDRLPRRARASSARSSCSCASSARSPAHFTPKQHFGFEAAAWYWHFVDVVWLFLFACIYVWGAGASRAPPATEATRHSAGGRYLASSSQREYAGAAIVPPRAIVGHLIVAALPDRRQPGRGAP